MENWTQKEQTQADVQPLLILDRLYETLPNPPYAAANDIQAAANRIYEYVGKSAPDGSLSPTG